MSKITRSTKRGNASKKSPLPAEQEVSYSVSDLPSLRRKRTYAYNRMSKALDVGIHAQSDPGEIDFFMSYHEKARNISQNFEEAHLAILELTQSEDENDIRMQQLFDEMYFKVLGIGRSFTKSSESNNDRPHIDGNRNIRLPKIELPKFSGSVKEWPEFIATYNALIHDSKTLSDTEKFHYLNSVLKGDAATVVRTFPISGDHYRDAYNALKARYENKRELAFTCWKDVLDLNLKVNNPQEFRRALDTVDENLAILKTLNLPIDEWDFVLVYLVLSKLDPKLRRDFEEKYVETEFPNYNDIKTFLHSKCEAMLRDTHFSEVSKTKTLSTHKDQIKTSHVPKRLNVSHALVASPKSTKDSSDANNLASSSSSAPSPTACNPSGSGSNQKPINKPVRKCSFCGNEHSITQCKTFLEKPTDERMKIASEKRWCFNCLNNSHHLKNCTSIFTCQKCKRKHHTLLHKDHSNDSSNINSDHVTLLAKESSTVLLATAIVQVKDRCGSFQSFRALLDTGSQNHFITEDAAKQLNLESSACCANVNGLGGASADIIGSVKCGIGINNSVKFDLDLYVIRQICGDQPITKLNTAGWSEIKSLPLADPGFDIPGPIDILLGAEVFAECLLNQRIKGTASQPPAFNSIFGWLLLGKVPLSSTALLGGITPMENDRLSSLVQRFWEIENVPQAFSLTPDEELCEYKYKTEHYRDETGRYVVRLPFKDNSEPIFEGTREIALRRFHAIERRLSRDPHLKRQYAEFMADYRDSGHMSLVPAKELKNGKCYIPHHCVLRPESATTKLRVVFDASAKDATSKSLNDTLLIGPKLQSNIVQILLHFREHEVVFLADVRQMYRQINVSPEHRDYQRIFWRTDPTEPVQEYALNTVTYGTSAAPFLACRTVKQLALDEGDAFPIAKQILTDDVYIDDICSGASNLSDAREAKSQVINMFKRGCLELRKWASNKPELLDDLRPEECLSEAIQFREAEDITIKVLGLKWEPASDAFVFNVQPSNQPCTKRSILSELARIFDPLGFLSPLTIQAKCLIQKLWIIGVAWDETPPEEIIALWNEYRTQLPLVRNLHIPRQIATASNSSYELHGFCDSSELAYGAAIYLRVLSDNDQAQVFLVCAKARVAPLKKVCLPRLELCGAVLLVDLIQLVKTTLRLSVSSTYLWTDSTVVLAWLRSHSSRWNTFVANRVSHIQNNFPTECWRHVPSCDNPADVCSRGQLPAQLIQNSLWWAGPTWLSQPTTTWPKLPIPNVQESAIRQEERQSVALVNEQLDQPHDEPSIIDILFEKHSSLDKIVRILSYVLRFVSKTRKQNLTVNNIERRNVLQRITKHFQTRYFAEEISKLRNNQPLPKTFRKLNPFIDEDGLLRVGGRIARSGLEYEHKHPILLPSNCPLTSAIIQNVHRSFCHPGLNTTQYLILQQYWILCGKRVIRQLLSKCVRCYRVNPQPIQPYMSDLPSFRVNQAKPFSIVGVDFGGPFRIKLGTHRGAKIDKAYLCLFVCLSTKAVHLEVVSSLSTEGFIAALRRFISRRGRCNAIHADRGTNFVGASNALKLHMKEAARTEQIDFNFNPPSAPHFGGVWEIQIKAAKTHLYRVVGEQTLTFEELSTLFTQIEAVLNSRPLCPLSSDPNDFNVLTPGHFLTLEPLTKLPEHDYTDVAMNRLTRWQLIQSFHQQFWIRWKNEYLHTLTQRAKWTKTSKPLKINSVVIIKDDNRVPLQWPLGRVLDLHPGPDGVVRIATIKTTQGTVVKRPLVKLCPLPID